MLAQSNSAQCRNPSGRHSSKLPLPLALPRDRAEELAPFRPLAVPLHEVIVLVEDSVRCSCRNQRLRAAPMQVRTSDPTAPLLEDISARQERLTVWFAF